MVVAESNGQPRMSDKEKMLEAKNCQEALRCVGWQDYYVTATN